MMEINYLECGTICTARIFVIFLVEANDVIPVILLCSVSFLVSVRIMSFSSLRDPSWRTNITPSDFNFTLRRIDVIGFAQELQDLKIVLIPISRFRTSLFSNFS